ncbi:MAG TPA: AAA family ATPase [Gammaproteobacteria bacterium]|nr:AAA family ATPase [Gammaproteobacteria bacterium]
MRIAVSGTHFIGKSTLIADFIQKYPDYIDVNEPYDELQDIKTMELALEPSLDSLLEELDYSILQLNRYANEKNIIYDRCPIDFIAYAMCSLERDLVDIHDSSVSEKFTEIKQALSHLDLIIFLPITKEHLLDYTEENPAFRKATDKCFKKIFRDEICDVFPKYGHPKIIEIWGDRLQRLKILESYII